MKQKRVVFLLLIWLGNLFSLYSLAEPIKSTPTDLFHKSRANQFKPGQQVYVFSLTAELYEETSTAKPVVTAVTLGTRLKIEHVVSPAKTWEIMDYATYSSQDIWYGIRSTRDKGYMYISHRHLAVFGQKIDIDHDGEPELILFNHFGVLEKERIQGEFRIVKKNRLASSLRVSLGKTKALASTQPAFYFYLESYQVFADLGFSPKVPLLKIKTRSGTGDNPWVLADHFFYLDRTGAHPAFEGTAYNTDDWRNSFQWIFPRDKGGQTNQVLIQRKERSESSQPSASELAGRKQLEKPRKIAYWTGQAFISLFPPGLFPFGGDVITASSVQKGAAGYNFEARNLSDNDPATSWQPATTTKGGVGQWVKIDFEHRLQVSRLEIFNGLQTVDKHGDEFYLNNRIKEATVYFSDNTSLKIRFHKDKKGPSVFPLPVKITEWLKIQIDSVYKGTKWNDLAVSEIRVHGVKLPVSLKSPGPTKGKESPRPLKSPKTRGFEQTMARIDQQVQQINRQNYKRILLDFSTVFSGQIRLYVDLKTNKVRKAYFSIGYPDTQRDTAYYFDNWGNLILVAQQTDLYCPYCQFGSAGVLYFSHGKRIAAYFENFSSENQILTVKPGAPPTLSIYPPTVQAYRAYLLKDFQRQIDLLNQGKFPDNKTDRDRPAWLALLKANYQILKKSQAKETLYFRPLEKSDQPLIISKNARLLAHPTPKSPVTYRPYPGTSVKILTVKKPDKVQSPLEYPWYYGEANGQKGWIYGGYLEPIEVVK